MIDPILEKYAQLIVHHGLGMPVEGRIILVSASVVAQPLMQALLKEILLEGGFYYAPLSLMGGDEIFLRYASEKQLQFIPPWKRLEIESIGGTIKIISGVNTRERSNFPQDKLEINRIANKELSLLYMERLNKGDLAWCVAQYPDDSDAQEAGMSLHEYEEFVFNACLLYKEDPVAEWKQFEKRQIKLCDWLKNKKEFHIIAPDTDLFINCAGRPWVNCGGTNNLPDGEVFTSPIENYTHGRIKYTYPGEFLGKVVNGVWLEFEEGKIVRCGADDNAELVEKELNFDEGARILGEFAFGTNYNVQRYTMNTLFDEKIGGTLHLAHGMAYAEAGGTNESTVHHDLILNLREQGEVWADGELIYKGGRFLLEY